MKYFKDFKSLCTPASIYLFINVIIFVSIAVQNFGNTTKYCVGQYRCQVPIPLVCFYLRLYIYYFGHLFLMLFVRRVIKRSAGLWCYYQSSYYLSLLVW